MLSMPSTNLSKERRQEHQQLQSDTCAADGLISSNSVPVQWSDPQTLDEEALVEVERFWVPNAELVDLRWMEFFFFFFFEREVDGVA